MCFLYKPEPDIPKSAEENNNPNQWQQILPELPCYLIVLQDLVRGDLCDVVKVTDRIGRSVSNLVTAVERREYFGKLKLSITQLNFKNVNRYTDCYGICSAK